MVIEVIGGYLSGSVSIWSEAAHMLSDFSGFAISMLSIYLVAKEPTSSLSYGCYRCEVIGALLSIMSIWGITAWLVYEAIERVVHGEYEIQGTIMLIVSIMSFIFNVIMVSKCLF